MSGDEAEEAGKGSVFPATRWTWVRGAAAGGGEEQAGALQALCRAYWYPIYLTARRKRGLGHHEAEDMAQGFFLWLLGNGHLGSVDEKRGRFRNFLAGYLDNYLRNQLRKGSAQKRGGGFELLSRDESEAWGARYEAELANNDSPDEQLDAAWRRGHLEAAFREVEASWERRGKGVVYQALKEYLKGGAERGGYRALSEELGMSEANVRQSMVTLRKDLRAAKERWEEGG